jgi:hypothetical protein
MWPTPVRRKWLVQTLKLAIYRKLENWLKFVKSSEIREEQRDG